MKCVIYTRQSREGSLSAPGGCDDQRMWCELHANRCGYEILRVIEDATNE